MNIPLLTIAALAAELDVQLAGRMVWTVSSLDPHRGLCLRTSRRLKDPALCLCTRQELFIPFIGHSPQQGAVDQPFARFLQRALSGSRIDSIRQWRCDRLLRIDFRRVDEIHGIIRRTLLLELVPRRHNIILLDPDRDQVQDAWRRVSGQMSRVRSVLPGRPFQPPPAPPGLHPLVHPWIDLCRAIGSKGSQLFTDALPQLLPWASEFLFSEISSRWSLEPNRACSEMPDDEIQDFWERLGRWLEQIQRGPEKPTLILDVDGKPYCLLPYSPRSVPEERQRLFQTLSLALQTIYQEAIARWDFETRRKELLSQLHVSLHRKRRALHHLETDLAQAGRAEEYKRLGEIIVANLGRLKKGSSRANLQDPYARQKKQVVVDLDPKLSPAQNAQRYFLRYRKARNGKPKIQARLEKTRLFVDEMERLREDLKTITEEDLLTELQAHLSHLHVSLSGQTSQPARGREPAKGSQPRSFRLDGGWTVLVGRNNRQNDMLTHHLASPDDLWFHAQGVPGSHVILRREGHKEEPGKLILEQTASLAAHFSRARHSGTVAVVYTAKRYVRRPRGAKPGLALVEREKTLFVRPQLPQELLHKDDK